jgi:hypothetical protein
MEVTVRVHALIPNLSMSSMDVIFDSGQSTCMRILMILFWRRTYELIDPRSPRWYQWAPARYSLLTLDLLVLVPGTF